MQEVLSIEQIRSGFIPRFIVVSGTTTSDQIRPIGPPVNVDESEDIKAKIVEELYQIVDFWMPKPKVTSITLGGTTAQRTVMQGEREMTATPDAWDRMRWLTFDAVKLGENSSSPDIYTPMYVRLADSIIKVAMLLAGSRCSSCWNSRTFVRPFAWQTSFLIQLPNLHGCRRVSRHQPLGEEGR
jgi:hypothetical protein